MKHVPNHQPAVLGRNHKMVYPLLELKKFTEPYPGVIPGDVAEAEHGVETRHGTCGTQLAKIKEVSFKNKTHVVHVCFAKIEVFKQETTVQPSQYLTGW